MRRNREQYNRTARLLSLGNELARSAVDLAIDVNNKLGLALIMELSSDGWHSCSQPRTADRPSRHVSMVNSTMLQYCWNSLRLWIDYTH